MPEPILRLAVAAPLPGFFDYLPPADFAGLLRPGMRLRVPFGRSTRIGVLWEIAAEAQIAPGRLKRALAVLDDAPGVDDGWRQLCRWVSDYYHHPIGETVATFLPVLLRQGKPAAVEMRRSWQLTETGRGQDLATLRRASRQQSALACLRRAAGPLDDAALQAALDGPILPTLRGLMAKGWVQCVEQQVVPPITTAPVPGPALNDEQQTAVQALTAAADHFRPFLLEGITGSGKTEVYLQTIAETLRRGRQTLVLVPEIGLTPQLIQRFRERLGAALTVLHSGLNDRERLAGWLQARDGQARVVIGTRSAVLTPLPDLGLIVVDEEHDLSYKQQEGLRYSARDLALRRAQQAGIPIVLGSATPSLETLHNAQQGRYAHLRLTQRAANAQPPRLATLDLRAQPWQEGLSPPLIRAIGQHLAADGQVLLFLNRRGYAPTWLCHHCGWAAECPRCDARVTYHHRAQKLRCHHCGHERRPDPQCPDCSSRELIPLGEGTERLEQALRQHFPRASIARIDRDSTRRKGALDRLLDDARARRTDILIGTQMLAKGHDFPDVTLAAIVNADSGLFSADFRAVERLGQLILQVAGRAGRAQRAGEVLIQTHQPDHPLFAELIHGGYAPFAQRLLGERQAAGLPPAGHLALLRAEAVDPAAPTRFLEQAAARARGATGLQCWGPAPAPRERLAGRSRAQLLLQASQRRDLHALLRHWVPQLGQLPGANKVRWALDVDPQTLD